MVYTLSALEPVQTAFTILISNVDDHPVAGAVLLNEPGKSSCPQSAIIEFVRWLEQEIRATGLARFPDYPTLLEVQQADLGRLDESLECVWQVGEPHALLCAASTPEDEEMRGSAGLQFLAPTSRDTCNHCDVPDGRLLCSHFSWPQVHASTSWGSDASRLLHGFKCQSGKAKSGSGCIPGVNECWQRQVQPNRPRDLPTYPPVALADALDHLNAAWRLRHGKQYNLFRMESAAVIAGLAGAANNADEFKARLDDLADALDRLKVDETLLPDDPKPEPGSLNHLTAWSIASLDDGASERAVEAISTFRSVRNARRSLAHANRRAELADQLAALGVHHPISDHQAAWDQVRSATIEAVSSFRRAITD